MTWQQAEQRPGTHPNQHDPLEPLRSEESSSIDNTPCIRSRGENQLIKLMNRRLCVSAGGLNRAGRQTAGLTASKTAERRTPVVVVPPHTHTHRLISMVTFSQCHTAAGAGMLQRDVSMLKMFVTNQKTQAQPSVSLLLTQGSIQLA